MTWPGLNGGLINKHLNKYINNKMAHLQMKIQKVQLTRETMQYTDLEENSKVN